MVDLDELYHEQREKIAQICEVVIHRESRFKACFSNIEIIYEDESYVYEDDFYLDIKDTFSGLQIEATGDENHPHVDNGDFCLGDNLSDIEDLILSGNLFAALSMCLAAFCSYNPGNCFKEIDFQEEHCAACGATGVRLRQCNSCDEYVCDNCKSSTACAACGSYCEFCGEYVNETYTCETCGETYCEGCDPGEFEGKYLCPNCNDSARAEAERVRRSVFGNDEDPIACWHIRNIYIWCSGKQQASLDRRPSLRRVRSCGLQLRGNGERITASRLLRPSYERSHPHTPRYRSVLLCRRHHVATFDNRAQRPV